MKKLYTHSFENNKIIALEAIDHENPYNFRQLHRHDYFEIFFFRTGGGLQQVDFTKFQVEELSVHIVPPGAVHLLIRENIANGFVIQFKKEALEFKQQEVLMQLMRVSSSKIYGQFNADEFNDLWEVLLLIQKTLAEDTRYSAEITSHYLSIVLFKIFEKLSESNSTKQSHPLLHDFQEKLDLNFKDIRTVSEYAQLLKVSPRKLSETTMSHLGKRPLELIHDRILLEIKRMLVQNVTSLKEISYQLNFESPMAFSKFVKQKTSKTPTVLSDELVEMYK